MVITLMDAATTPAPTHAPIHCVRQRVVVLCGRAAGHVHGFWPRRGFVHRRELYQFDELAGKAHGRRPFDFPTTAERENAEARIQLMSVCRPKQGGVGHSCAQNGVRVRTTTTRP
ncbi:hypothetical protein MRX96_020487 [Rhipicephalus microplus]